MRIRERKQSDGSLEFEFPDLAEGDRIDFLVDLLQRKAGLSPSERLVDVSYLAYVYTTDAGEFTIYLQDYMGLYARVEDNNAWEYCRHLFASL